MLHVLALFRQAFLCSVRYMSKQESYDLLYSHHTAYPFDWIDHIILAHGYLMVDIIAVIVQANTMPYNDI